LIGTSGKRCLVASQTDERVVAITLFIGPLQGGLEPLRSKRGSLPSFVTSSRIHNGSSTTPVDQ
jgi:hypothetical protein